MTIVAGHQLCPTRALKLHEAAVVLRRSDRDGVFRSSTSTEVRNLLRRGQRLQDRGLSPAAIAQRGALAVTWSGNRRLVSVESLVALIADDELALLVLADILHGRCRVPAGKPVELYDFIRSRGIAHS